SGGCQPAETQALHLSPQQELVEDLRAIIQLKLVCENLPTRPISLWDSEYGCASFINQTSDIPADKLMRLCPNQAIYDVPPPYSGKGPPRSHGAKFKHGRSFRCDWYTGCFPQTPWKVSWLAYWENSLTQNSLPYCQKDYS
ncbi:MAG: hypothetical protein ACLBM6_13050, partial [Cuspidothrix sp.]